MKNNEYMVKMSDYVTLEKKVKELEDRIDRAINLLQHSVIYTSRQAGKTVFNELIKEEIDILRGDV